MQLLCDLEGRFSLGFLSVGWDELPSLTALAPSVECQQTPGKRVPMEATVWLVAWGLQEGLTSVSAPGRGWCWTAWRTPAS